MVATVLTSAPPPRALMRAPLARAAASVGAAAVAVSAAGSWIPSLWGDEAASLLSARRPLGSLFAMLTHVDAVHGLSYVALHFWIRIFGTSPFAVRFPSAIAVGVCAAGVVWLCGRFGTVRFAVVAGCLAALLPRLTYAGEEARAYAWDAAIATVLCVIVAEIMRRREPSRRWWIAYGVVLAVGIFAFLYLGLMTLAVGFVLALTRDGRGQLRRWAAASAAAVVVASPVIVFAVLERTQIAFLAHRAVVTPHAILVAMWFGATPFAVLAWTLIVIAVVGTVRDALRSPRAPMSGSAPLAVLALAWLVIPVGVLLAGSAVMAGFTARYGTFAAPAAAVLMALGLRRLVRAGGPAVRRWGPAALVAALLLAAVVPVWTSQRSPFAKNQSDWNQIATTVSTIARTGDAIVFDEGTRPSRRPRLAMDTDPGAFAAVKDVTLKTPYAASTTWHDTAYTVDAAAARARFTGVERVLVVEYAMGGTADDWGVAELRALGFRRVHAVDLHRSVVSVYER